MCHGDAASEPDHAAGGDEILAAARPQIIDAQVDGADVLELRHGRQFGFGGERRQSDGEATDHIQRRRYHATMQDTGLPTNSGRMSNLSRGAFGSSASSFRPSTRLNGIIFSKARPTAASMPSASRRFPRSGVALSGMTDGSILNVNGAVRG